MLFAYLAASWVAALATLAVLGPVIGFGAVLVAPLAASAAVAATAVAIYVRNERRSVGGATRRVLHRASE
jgi:hypothetical protein